MVDSRKGPLGGHDALKALVTRIGTAMRAETDRGKVADYIPELAGVDNGQFAIAVCLPDGQVIAHGDAETRFSIQSVSKVFTLAIALGRYGTRIWERVGREPSNAAFNSVMDVELGQGRPRNPFVNAGAIVVTDILLADHAPRDALAEILSFMRCAAGCDDIYMDPAVAASEKRTGDRNWALGHYLRSAGNLRRPVEMVLGTYFHHCAIEMTCIQLARAGRFLAGLQDGGPLVGPENLRSLNALMMTCGHYDGSGEFAFRVGIPAKSGVGGGILAVLPGVASIAVWGPGLDRFGNSRLGTRALEMLSREAGISLFEPLGPRRRQALFWH